jgi:hypothetical protein
LATIAKGIPVVCYNSDDETPRLQGNKAIRLSFLEKPRQLRQVREEEPVEVIQGQLAVKSTWTRLRPDFGWNKSDGEERGFWTEMAAVT